MGYGSGGDALGGLFLGLWSWMICLGWVIPMLIGVAAVAVWIVVLIDVLQRAPADFPNARAGRVDPNERLIWLFVVLLVGTIGAVVYYFMVMKPYPRPKQGESVADTLSPPTEPVSAPEAARDPAE